MKILQINVVYNKGSTGKIVNDIHTELVRNGHESVICYGRGEKTHEKNVFKTCGELYSKVNNFASRLTGLMYGGCFWSTRRLISIIKKQRPDVVHLHCLNGYFVNVYRLISWLKESGIKTILTLHAEFMHTANCPHAFECDKWLVGCGKCPRLKAETKTIFFDGTHRSWRKMKKAFDGFDDLTVVSVSPWLQERAERSPILKDLKHTTVFNGLDTDIFKPTESCLLEEYGLSGKKIIFHATPNFDDDPNNLKGGCYVIEVARRMPDAVFAVAGDFSRGLAVPENIVLLGNVSDQELLAKWYTIADVTLLTSKRETFSMVVAESLCCGTPVVGFRAGGPETIAIPEYSEFVEYGDVEGVIAKIKSIFASKDRFVDISNDAAYRYSKKRMCDDYKAKYEERIRQ